MAIYRAILIPTDGSRCSDAAVAHGLVLAKALGSRVVFLFVMDTLLLYREGVVTFDDALRTLRADGQRVVERAERSASAAGVTAEHELIEGQPDEVIVDRSRDFDLVVMASHGKGFLARLTVGSVTEKVLHRIARPLLVIRCAPPREETLGEWSERRSF